MIYLLIDTCSWKQLVNKSEKSKELLQFQKWVDDKEVCLLCPDVLIEEWQKHRETEKRAITKKLAEEEKKFKLFSAITESQLSIAYDTLLSQIKIIDTLITNAKPLRATEPVKLKSFDHLKEKKAPFHNKENSLNDSLLIFSVLEFIEQNGIEEVFVLSDNHKDFGSLENANKLHNEIISEYPNITARYFRKPQEIISELIKNKGLSPLKIDNDIVKVSQRSSLIISRDQPVIDQLYEYVTRRYKEINFYPLHLLRADFPFKIQDKGWTHYGIYTLDTDNFAIQNLFRSLNFKNYDLTISDPIFTDNVVNPEQKVKQILKKLNNNLIFFIRHGNAEKTDIRLIDEAKCQCISCIYNRFSFESTFDLLNPINQDSRSDLMKRGYINYQIGNFINAYHIFDQIAISAKENDEYTTFTIAQYNLSKLAVFIGNHYWGERSQNEIIEKLTKISLNDILKGSRNIENDDLVNWLVNGSFYTDSLIRINDLVKNIRDNYELQTGGGFSSNSDVVSLINEFAAFETFLNSNLIVFDGFSEFDDLFEIFTEGLLASHAIPEKQGSKLVFFDDYLLKRLVYYSKPEVFKKYLRRYNIKSLRAKITSPKGEGFIDLCFNFLDGIRNTETKFNILCENENTYFWRKYNRIYSNMLILLRYLDLDVSAKIIFVEKIFAFLCDEAKIDKRDNKYLIGFLWSVKDELSTKAKKDFSDFILFNAKYHSEDAFELVGSFLDSGDKRNKVSKHNFLKIEDLFFKGEFTTEYKNSSIVYFYKACNSKQKSVIKHEIEKILKSKFDYNLYYRSVIYDVIEYRNHFDQFLRESNPRSRESSFESVFFGSEDKRFASVGCLINLCYKVKIDLQLSVFDPIRQIDPYYQWLLDLDNFNYSNFVASWVLEYRTIHFSQRFKACSKLKIELANSLKSNKSKDLLEAFINIYN